jgi:uncharacterized protein YlxW (UPF0749 family)
MTTMRRLSIPSAPRDRLLVGVVAAILGVLAVGQFRGQTGVPALSGLSAQELTLLIANLNEHNEQLRNEIAGLEAQARSLEESRSSGQTTVDDLTADLARIRAWSGAIGLSGPGVAITVSGPIGGDGVEDILNELRNAGAEALMVADVRVVPGVVVAGGAGAISVEDTALEGTFEIRAIGSPEILLGTLNRAGGVIDQIGAGYPDVRISVTPLERVTIPASDRNLVPSHGRPRL